MYDENRYTDVRKERTYVQMVVRFEEGGGRGRACRRPLVSCPPARKALIAARCPELSEGELTPLAVDPADESPDVILSRAPVVVVGAVEAGLRSIENQTLNALRVSCSQQHGSGPTGAIGQDVS